MLADSQSQNWTLCSRDFPPFFSAHTVLKEGGCHLVKALKSLYAYKTPIETHHTALSSFRGPSDIGTCLCSCKGCNSEGITTFAQREDGIFCFY